MNVSNFQRCSAIWRALAPCLLLLALALPARTALAAAPAQAATIHLCARATTLTLPDGTVTAWGYAPGDCTDAAPAQVPGPVLAVAAAAELEAEYGIKVRLVAVTAGGGMVDFRYRVLDAHKAMQLLRDHATMPVILDDSGAPIHGPAGMIHDRPLETGRTYFLHYPNSAGVVHAGDAVTVVMGNVKLPPIRVQ